MKWLKKWGFLLLLAGSGFLYLSFVDRWQVYAEPLAHAEYILRQLEGRQQDDLQPEPPQQQTVSENEGGTQAGDSAAQDGMQAEDSAAQDDTQAGGSVAQDGAQAGGSPAQDIPEAGDSAAQDGAQAGDSAAGDITEDVTEDFVTVGDDYFSDALFLGDSRTVGMYEYGGLEDIATFYASTGLTVYKMFDAKIVSVPGQKKKISVEEALGQNSFRKIYLMIGINEMGTGTVETFAAKYKEAVDHLLTLQPDAIVYIQAIMKVTTERSGQGDYITNEGIDARNEAIAALADNDKVFYLDVNPQLCDDTGGMREDYTFDGVHLKAQYIEIWKNYLEEHAIVR